MNLGGPEMLIVLAVVLLIFGSKKVPELARSLGKAQKEFKDGMKDDTTPSDAAWRKYHYRRSANTLGRMSRCRPSSRSRASGPAPPRAAPRS